MKRILLALFLLMQDLTALYAQTPAEKLRKSYTEDTMPGTQTGVASYYHSKFNGRLTANGEIYDETKLTAAHNRLPLGTRIRVTNMHNKRSVVVRVNDRLHHRNTRLVDLSRAAASKLGYIGRGLTRVRVEVLKD